MHQCAALVQRSHAGIFTNVMACLIAITLKVREGALGAYERPRAPMMQGHGRCTRAG